MNTIKTILQRHTASMTLYLLLGILSALLSAWSASLMQSVLDGFTAHTLSLALVFTYGGAMIALCLVNYAINLPESKLSNGLYLDFKIAALRKMERIDYRHYLTLGTGLLVQRMETGAQAGRDVIFGFWLQLFSSLLPEMLSSLFFIACIDQTVALWLLLGYIAVFFISTLLLKALYRIKNRILIDEETFSGRLVRGLMEMVTFRINRRYSAELFAVCASRDRIVRDKTHMQLVHELFFTLFAILVSMVKLGFLLYAYFAGHLTAGEFAALTMLVDKAYQPIAVLNVLYVQYKLNRMAFARYHEILSAPDNPRMSDRQPAQVDRGALHLKNVTCSYGSRVILHNLSLEIPAGEVIGLAGESGSGKSTCVKLLLGLLSPDRESVLVDGCNLAQIHLPMHCLHTAGAAGL